MASEPVSPADEALRDRVAVPTRERIERDEASASPRLQPLLAEILLRLFDVRFDVNELLRCCRAPRDALIAFHHEMGEAPWEYISKARLEVAARLLRQSQLTAAAVARLVGYSNRKVFGEAFRRSMGLPPGRFRRRWRLVEARVGPPPEELHSQHLLRELRRGTLQPGRARRLLAFFGALGEGPAAPTPTAPNSRPRPGATAELLRTLLDGLPRAARPRWARAVIRVDTPTLFLLLGEEARAAWTRAPQQALVAAELALAHLAGNGVAWSEAAGGLRALGLAWLANARRCTGDSRAAAHTFARAWQAWQASGRDRTVEAELCDLEATLLKLQRRYPEARHRLERAIALALIHGEDELLVRSLLQRVSITGYGGRPEATLSDLEMAQRKLEGLDQPLLALTTYGHLATSYALAGRYHEALEALPRARHLCEELKEATSSHQLDWVEGLARRGLGELEAAERLFARAQEGFLALGAAENATLASLEIVLVDLLRGRPEAAARRAAEAIPLLGAMHLTDETLAAVELLRRAMATEELSFAVVEKVCKRLADRAPDSAAR